MVCGYFFNLVYILILLVFSPVLVYRAARQGKYMTGWKQKFFGRIPKRRFVLKGKTESPSAKVIWLHAVSVGEINLLRPLLARIRADQPEWVCTISTTSRTGMELAKKLYGKQYTVFYCPLDFTWAVKTAVNRLNPDMLILVEQELWTNLIDACSRNGTKIAVINARFSEKGHKHYLWIRPFLRNMFKKIDLIAAQSETYAGWFRQLGAVGSSVYVTGSIKFDGANTDRNNTDTQRLKPLAGITENDTVFLAGSTQAPEEALAVETYLHLQKEFPQLMLIIVPRHQERFEEVAAMLDNKGVRWQRRSSIKEQGVQSGETSRRILLVDTIGELGAWWGTAAIAFVGGSLHPRGGQSMIEPAAYGAAVSFGPNTKNFQQITDLLLQKDAAVVVHDQYEMEHFVRRCLEDPEYAAGLGNRARELVQQQAGSAQRTLELLTSLFHSDKDENDVSRVLSSVQ